VWLKRIKRSFEDTKNADSGKKGSNGREEGELGGGANKTSGGRRISLCVGSRGRKNQVLGKLPMSGRRGNDQKEGLRIPIHVACVGEKRLHKPFDRLGHRNREKQRTS